MNLHLYTGFTVPHTSRRWWWLMLGKSCMQKFISNLHNQQTDSLTDLAFLHYMALQMVTGRTVWSPEMGVENFFLSQCREWRLKNRTELVAGTEWWVWFSRSSYLLSWLLNLIARQVPKLLYQGWFQHVPVMRQFWCVLKPVCQAWPG